MKIKIIKDSAEHIAKQYGLVDGDIIGVESALVNTETKSIKFEYRTSGAPANLVERSYPLKSDDGMIVAEVAYYDNFSHQGL